MKTELSSKLFERARQKLPGGVDSPVRAFKAVGGTPIFIRYARGAKMIDADDNVYVDYVGSWGPMILGHAHPRVLSVVREALKNGTSFGASCESEVHLAEEICRAVPSVQKVRFVNSGTEAVMGAVRVARGFTKRAKIIKFDGCYHGHADYLLVKAGSGAAALGIPDSAGVPAEFAAATLVARFNDLKSVEDLMSANPGAVAAVIVEPIVGNMGVILPREGFLKGLQDLCAREGALLIFDEVMTGFRASYGGAQTVYDVQPDLTTFGKIIGGGFPVGAYGGRREIMDLVSPEGPVYQAGTLSGNPIAMAAGLETLSILRDQDPYNALNQKTQALVQGLREAAEKFGIPVCVERAASMFTLFFTGEEVVDADSARRSDTARFAKFFQAMLERGVYLAPSQFEACFVSTAHSEKEIEKTIKAARAAFKALS